MVTVPRLIEVDLSVVAVVAAVVVYLEREVVWSSVPSSRPLLVGLTDCCCCCVSLLSLWWCPAKEEEEDEVVDSSELLFANMFLISLWRLWPPKTTRRLLVNI